MNALSLLTHILIRPEGGSPRQRYFALKDYRKRTLEWKIGKAGLNGSAMQ